MTWPYRSGCPPALYRPGQHNTEPTGRTREWGTAYRSKGEIAVAQALQHLEIPFAYEPRLDLRPVTDPGNAYRGIDGVVYTRPDFYLLDGSGIVIEYAGMLDRADYLHRHRDKIDLYAANGVAFAEVLPEDLHDDRLSVSVLKRLIADSLERDSTPRRDLGDLARAIQPD